jgi:hypothetical protein
LWCRTGSSGRNSSTAEDPRSNPLQSKYRLLDARAVIARDHDLCFAPGIETGSISPFGEPVIRREFSIGCGGLDKR